MPNNQREDYVPPHQHAAGDVNGLAVALFPPTQIAVGTTSNPTVATVVWQDLEEMEIEVTPPSYFPLWEAQVVFTGTFASDTAGTGGSIRLQLDGVTLDETTRSGTSPDNDAPFQLVSEAATRPTRLLLAGVAATFTVQWALAGLGPVLTAVDELRRMEVVIRPYTGVVP